MKNKEYPNKKHYYKKMNTTTMTSLKFHEDQEYHKINNDQIQILKESTLCLDIVKAIGQVLKDRKTQFSKKFIQQRELKCRKHPKHSSLPTEGFFKEI